jgi:hypothetical protein
LQVLSFDFINYDDAKYVTNNFHIQIGFTPSAIQWAFTTLHAGFWQPLVWLSFMPGGFPCYKPGVSSFQYGIAFFIPPPGDENGLEKLDRGLFLCPPSFTR